MSIYDGTKTRNKTLFCTPRDWRPRQRRHWELWSVWGDTAWPALPFRTTCQSSGVFSTGEGSLFSLPPGQQVHRLEIKVSFLDFVILPVTKLTGGVCWNYCVCVCRLCPNGIFESAQPLQPNLVWLVHYRDLECCGAEIGLPSTRSRSQGVCHQKVTVSTMFSECLQPNLVWW